MQKDLRARLIPVIIVVMLSAVAASAQPETPNVGLTVTGSADSQLVDRITRDLQSAAKKLPQGNVGEFAADLSSKPSEFVVSQFKKVLPDIPYTNTNIPAQRLDIIYPFVGNGPYKVIVNFHGGGWQTENKRSADSGAVQLATYQGYVVVNPNYRLSGEAKWPAQLYDAKAAVRFIRANAAKYRLDASEIVVWGNSSGGHIAEMLAATNSDPKMEDLSMGNPNASSSVQGVVSWYGVSDITGLTRVSSPFADKLMGYPVKGNEDRAKAASPIEYVTKDFPPILFVHGTNDQVVPFTQSVRMAERVNAVTGKEQAKVKLFINASHGDPTINTVGNVSDNLYFVDGILFPSGRNPYRSTVYESIAVTK